MVEKFFWKVLEYLKSLHPIFASSRLGKRLMHRFKQVSHVVDSTTIQLVSSCMAWAKHRRRKAAEKCHLRLDLQGFVPRFAMVGTAKNHDNTRARELCVGVKEGEIVLFDKIYMYFVRLFEISTRRIF